jgi:hypothetical protein
MYKGMGLNVRDQLAWAAGAVVGPPLFDSTWLRQALGSGASAIGFAVGIGLLVAALAFARQPRRHDGFRALAIHASCIGLFYGLYLPATWFFRRYLVPVYPLVGIGCALVLARIWWERDRRRWRARAALAAVAVAVAAALGAIGGFATARPSMTVDQGHHGAKGYREPARQILALAPAGAVIGSFQSAALGWFSDRSGVRVVNLDGVVDGEARRAVRARRIAAFARARGVTHLADWEVNVNLFLDRSGDAAIVRGSLRAIGDAEPQGDAERFVLYEIVWPDAR